MVTQCLLSGLLDSWGYEVHTASNGREGMAVLRCVGADVVITDIIMPEQDGFATIALLRRDFPDVKVIAISGGGGCTGHGIGHSHGPCHRCGLRPAQTLEHSQP